jgi:hypothetical protein
MSNWVDLFSQIELAYTQVAQLLRGADGLMEKRGFSNLVERKGVAIEGSTSLDRPSWWFPGWVGRFYQPAHSNSEHHILHVGVLLYKRTYDDIQPLEEPVVTAGIWTFPQENRNWKYWMMKEWAICSPLPDYGIVVEKEINRYQVHTNGHLFAVRLESICCLEDLEKIVIHPLDQLRSEIIQQNTD